MQIVRQCWMWHSTSEDHFQQEVFMQAGQVRISTEAATLEHMAQQFWHRILAMADLNDDQQLSLDEFQTLMVVRQQFLTDHQRLQVFWLQCVTAVSPVVQSS